MTNFPRDFNSQVTFFDALKTRLNAMESVANPVFLNQTTEPTQLQWETAWVTLGNTLPIDTKAELYWYDGTQMRGIYGTIDDWVTPMLTTKWHWQHDPTLSGAMPLGSAAFIDDSSYVFLYTDSQLGVTTVLLGKVVQGVFSQITTGAAVVSAASPIRVNPAGTKVAFRDTAGNLRTINTDGTGLATVVATVCSQIGDWKSTQILYVDSSNVIKYINENATGNTTVISKFGSVIKGLRFDATLTRIYYSVTTEIRSCTLAGASDQIESYAGNFSIVDTYSTDRIVFKDDFLAVSGTVSYTNPIYKIATITDIKNTAKEFTHPIDFRDQLKDTESTSPGPQVSLNATTTYDIRPTPLNVPPYSAMNQFYRPANYFDKKYAQNFVHDVSPNNRNVILSTGLYKGFYVGANRDEGYESTGKVYRLNSWEGSTPDFVKLGTISFSPVNNIVTFALPQTYTHLLIEGALVSNGVANFGLVRFNGDSTATNYMSLVIANAAAQVKTEYLAKQGGYVGWAGTVLTPFRFYVLNYRGNHIKSTISNTGIAGTNNVRVTSVWNSTAAITSISFVLEGGVAFGATSTADVYGYQGQGRYW